MKQLCLWAILALCTWTATQAQSVEEDLKRLYKNFDGAENLYFELENRIVKGEELGFEQKGKVYKKGDYYAYRMGDYELLVNKRYILIIDHSQRTIVCNSWSKAQADRLRAKKMPTVEDLLERYPTVHYHGIKDGYKHYTFKNEKESLYKVDIFFEVASGFAKKTVYHYHPNLAAAGAEIRMSLPVIDTDPSFPKGIFSERQFIVERNGQLQPTSRYAQYTVHDLRYPASK